MVVSTWWLRVVPYQNILITGSKAISITTERKYPSVCIVLREVEKVDQKKCSKKLCISKIMQRWKTKQKLRKKNGVQSLHDFYQRDIFSMRYLLRLKYFEKFPRNAKIRYWAILLKPSHIEITFSVNGYTLFVSGFLNVFLNEIREQKKTSAKCQIFWNLRKTFFRGKKSQFYYLLEKRIWCCIISLFVKMCIGWFFGSISAIFYSRPTILKLNSCIIFST